MFTGIVLDKGRVTALAPAAKSSDTRLVIATSLDLSATAIGASIACSGCCLTAIEKGADWFAAEASAETLSKTTLGAWKLGTPVNLEPSLKLGQELGGHIVSGHVDGTAVLVSVDAVGGSHKLVFEVAPEFARLIAPKGSVALDGVSLTLNDVADRPDGTCRFSINVIPHTWSATTLGGLAPGDRVNLEIDTLARYVARILGK
jgi:riboflavin synthase